MLTEDCNLTVACTGIIWYMLIDEEIGHQGMKLFIETEEFRSLNVGCALDEGAPSPPDFFFIFYAEKSIWRK